MKLIDIFKSASSNILQSKLRTFLTVIAIFIGAFTLTLTTGIGAGISQYIDSQVNSIGAKNLLVISAKQKNDFSSSDTPQKYDPNRVTSTIGGARGGGIQITVLTQKDIETIKKIDGISDVSGVRAVTPSYIVGPNMTKYEVSTAEYITGTNLAMTNGSEPDNSSSEAQIDLPYNYVTSLGFNSNTDALGKTVKIGISDANGTISEVDATVIGIPQKSLITSNGAEVNSTLFDKLYTIQSTGLPSTEVGKYPQLIAHFPTSYSDAQITDLKNRLDKAGYTGSTIQDQIGVLKSVIQGIVVVFDLFAVIALLAASFGVINTLLMSVQERTKEIGLMKAMGMGRGKIFLLFSTEAVLLGFWGSFLGVLVAALVGKVANRIATHGFLSNFSGLNLLAFPLTNILEIILGIMLIAFLAGTLPALRASRLDPIEALRYE